MAQDPAFLMYYKDWLVSTAGWDADIRGWYINLMCHQADKPDGLPDDMESLAELAGVKISLYQRFCECWKRTLKAKFEANEHGLLENIALKRGIEKRRNYSENQTERGIIGFFIKQAKSEHALSDAMSKELFKSLKKENLLSKTKEERNNCYKRTLIALLGNAIGNAIVIKENIGGVGEKGEKQVPDSDPGIYIVPKMMSAFKKKFPKYLINQEKDFPALCRVALSLCEYMQTPKDFANQAVSAVILKTWEGLVGHIGANKHFSGYNLVQVEKYLQSILQDFNKPKEPEKTAMQYLYERYCEGQLDSKLLTDGHYNELLELGFVSVVTPEFFQKVKLRRIDNLTGSNQSSDLRLYQDYQSGQETEATRKDAAVIEMNAKRSLMLGFFKRQQQAMAKNVLEVKTLQNA